MEKPKNRPYWRLFLNSSKSPRWSARWRCDTVSRKIDHKIAILWVVSAHFGNAFRSILYARRRSRRRRRPRGPCRGRRTDTTEEELKTPAACTHRAVLGGGLGYSERGGIPSEDLYIEQGRRLCRPAIKIEIFNMGGFSIFRFFIFFPENF